MRWLAIECATQACSVALFEGETLLAADHRLLGRGHAEHLVPMIAGLPDKGKAERILVSLGPGSFTGVRIGLATARALGIAWRADVLGYPTLALIAAMAQAGHAEPVTVCMAGGHGEWFVQEFDKRAEPQGAVQSLAPQDAAQSARQILIAGSKANDLVQMLDGDHTALDLLPDARQAHLLSEGALSRQLAPIYGRPPDAKLPA